LTVAPSATPTPTTALPPHFECYNVIAPRQSFPEHAVTLVDRLGTTHGSVSKPAQLCYAVDPSGTDPAVTASKDRLLRYQLRASHRHARQRVANEFGVQTLNVFGPGSLMVPSAAEIGSMPVALGSPSIDHFTCYAARPARGQTRIGPQQSVSLVDQLGSLTATVGRPVRLCIPADKDGEAAGTETHVGSLVCYRLSPRRRLQGGRIFTANQFGSATLLATLSEELCVPSVPN
jgi:hypothetical protein